MPHKKDRDELLLLLNHEEPKAIPIVIQIIDRYEGTEEYLEEGESVLGWLGMTLWAKHYSGEKIKFESVMDALCRLPVHRYEFLLNRETWEVLSEPFTGFIERCGDNVKSRQRKVDLTIHERMDLIKGICFQCCEPSWSVSSAQANLH